jgi:hypothetical protein
MHAYEQLHVGLIFEIFATPPPQAKNIRRCHLEGKYEKWKEEIQENVGEKGNHENKGKVKRAKMQKGQN